MGKVERKRQILESAARLFSARRFDEVLMDEIASEAGVAKGTLYAYFPDKEELYFAVVFEGISRLNEQLAAQAALPGAPEERLHGMLHALVSFLRRNRFFFKLMAIEDTKGERGPGTNRARWREERARQLASIEAVLRNGTEAGVFDIRHPRAETRILREMVRSALMAAGDELTAEELVALIMRIFLDGVRRRT